MRAARYRGNRQVTADTVDGEPPLPGEVTVQVAYCGLCGTDLHIFQGHMDQRVTTPHVLGHEMSGTVVRTGDGVSQCRAGDHVVVRPLVACGRCPACRAGHAHICHDLVFLGIDRPGALQSEWTVPAHTLHAIPAELPLELAALVEPLAVACHAVRRADLAEGERVVVIGAGPIGVLTGLVAQRRGADVLLADVNRARVTLALQLGLDAVDPGATDLAAHVDEWTRGAGADAAFEASGSQSGAESMARLVRARGRVVVVAIFAAPAPVDLFRVFWREVEIRGARVYEPADFDEAIALAAAGELPLKRLVSATVGLDQVGNMLARLTEGDDAMKVLVEPGRS